jgi:hypothetical protein
MLAALKADPWGAPSFMEGDAPSQFEAVTSIPPLSFVKAPIRGMYNAYGAIARGEQPDPGDLLAVAGGVGAPGLGKAAAPGEVAFGAGPIRAWHASPHDFGSIGERPFSLSKVGTGEGNQAFGHGIYSAQGKPTADSYFEQFSRRPVQEGNMFYNGRPIDERHPELPTPDLQSLAKVLVNRGDRLHEGDFGAAWDEMSKRRTDPTGVFAHFGRNLDKIDPTGLSIGPKARMYELDIHENPEKLLDWDVGTTRQSPHVRGVMDRLDLTRKLPDASGQNIWKYLVGVLERKYGEGAPAEAANILDSAGIPGIKYLDRASRLGGGGLIPKPVIQALNKLDYLGFDTPGQAMRALRENLKAGHNPMDIWDLNRPEDAAHAKTIMDYLHNPPSATRNYVSFDPSTIEIIGKYGIPAVMGLGAAGMEAVSGVKGKK